MSRTQILSNFIKSPVLKDDLLESYNTLLVEKKYSLYTELEIRFLMEHYFRTAYEYLREKNIIDYDDNQKYCYLNGYSNEFSLYYGLCSRMNLIGYSRLEGYNIIGLSLNPSKCNWNDYITTYKYYYVIEFCVDVFCNKYQSEYFDIYVKNRFNFISQNYSVDVLFKALDKDTKPSTMKNWFKNFNHKEWKHFLIYENETRYPNTFLFQIRKWYAPQLFYHEQKNKNIIYEKKICEKIFTPLISNTLDCKKQLFLEKEKKLENLYHSQDFQQKKKFLQMKEYKKIVDWENSELTSLEIKKMRNYIPKFTFQDDVNYIETNNPLSPIFPHNFTFQNKKFETILDFVHFKFLCHFVSPKDAYLQKSKDFYQNLIIVKNSFYNKKKFELLSETMNDFNFKIKLLKNDNINDTILKEQKNDFDILFVNQEFKEEKMRFLHQFQLFNEWFEKIKTNKSSLSVFLNIFYPHYLYKNDLEEDEEYISAFYFELDDNSIMNIKEIFTNFSEKNFNFLNNFISTFQNLDNKRDFIIHNFQFCLLDIVKFYPKKISFEFDKIKSQRNGYCDTIWIENCLSLLKSEYEKS